MDDKDCETEIESMGFKDKEKALYTLNRLDGRDISYQHRAIVHYRARAKKKLTYTKDERKRKNMGEAIEVFDEWLRDYKENNRGKSNLSYLPIETIEALKPLAESYGISDTDFYTAYKKKNGDYRAMRSVKINDDEGAVTWDIERNKRLKGIIGNIRSKNLEWYETNDETGKECPSREHARCILLGYSPDGSKLKALATSITKIFQRSEAQDKLEVDEASKKRGTKRNHECPSSSDESSDNEEPARKTPRKKLPRSEKQEEGSGLGFKDKEKALRSIESLEGRDVSYQYHALTGLIKRATRVISCTKDEEKIKNMKAAVEVFEKWVTDYNVNHRSRENFGYLALDLVQAYEPLAEKYGLEISGFVRTYEQVGGDYKKLRSVKVKEGDITWDIERNKHLKQIVAAIKEKHKQWFETDEPMRGLPTKEHTECIMWGFSHEPARLKKTLTLLSDKLPSVD